MRSSDFAAQPFRARFLEQPQRAVERREAEERRRTELQRRRGALGSFVVRLRHASFDRDAVRSTANAKWRRFRIKTSARAPGPPFAKRPWLPDCEIDVPFVQARAGSRLTSAERSSPTDHAGVARATRARRTHVEPLTGRAHDRRAGKPFADSDRPAPPRSPLPRGATIRQAGDLAARARHRAHAARDGSAEHGEAAASEKASSRICGR